MFVVPLKSTVAGSDHTLSLPSMMLAPTSRHPSCSRLSSALDLDGGAEREDAVRIEEDTIPSPPSAIRDITTTPNLPL
jgi:hypothetical protein